MEILKQVRDIDCSDEWAVTRFQIKLNSLALCYPNCDIFIRISASPTDRSLPRSKMTPVIEDDIRRYLNFNVDISICTIEVIT